MTLKLTSSIDRNDINKVLSIVATFGADEQGLFKIQEYIKEELNELGDNRVLYFLEESSVIAMVQLIFKNADDDPDLANGKDIAQVHSLQVSKIEHRRGYGYKFMQLLELEAKSLGIIKLTLGVDSDNEKAMNLYRKLNYTLMKTLEGRTPDVKLHCMQKQLL